MAQADRPSLLDEMLAWALSNGLLGREDLVLLRSNLEDLSSLPTNSVRNAVTYRALARWIANSNLELGEVDRSFERALVRLSESNDQRSVVEAEVVVPFRRAQFLPFKRESGETFEVMDTVVTKWMWSVLRESPLEKFETGDSPATNFYIYEISLLLTGLNAGDVPYERVREVIPDHRPGDLYAVMEPEIFQWLVDTWFRENISQDPSIQHLKGVREYAWFDRTMDTIMPVAQLKPLLIQSQKVFDLLGNVSQMGIIRDDHQQNTVQVYVLGGCMWTRELKEEFLDNFGLNGNPDLMNLIQVRSRNDQMANWGLRLVRLYRGDPD